MAQDLPGSDSAPFSHPLRVADLPTRKPVRFDLVPTEADRAAISEDLDLVALRKLRFTGTLSASGNNDWILQADLGATVTQNCVVTLEPVTTRLDEKTERRWSGDLPVPSSEEEVEMPDDETLDPLEDVIDLGQVMCEALALALPLYPRADGADMDAQVFAEPGVTPMTDDDAKPFAGLADLRDRLSGGQDDDET